MSYYNYTKGMGNVGSYQISGIPYASGNISAGPNSGTPIEIDFPNVTRFVNIRNGDPTAALRVGFSAHGVKGQGPAGESNYYHLISPSGSLTLDVRVAELYLISHVGSPCVNVSISAGLTGISETELPTNWSGSAGVG
jgi:hypothetical protein